MCACVFVCMCWERIVAANYCSPPSARVQMWYFQTKVAHHIHTHAKLCVVEDDGSSTGDAAGASGGLGESVLETSRTMTGGGAGSAAAMSKKSACASLPDVETDKQREGRRWQGRCMRDESIEKSSCVALQLLLTLPFRCISGKKARIMPFSRICV